MVLFLLNGEVVEAGGLPMSLRRRVIFRAVIVLIGIGVILPEEICNQSIVINNGSAFVSGSGIKFPEEAIHGLGVKLEVSLHLLHPRLVHAVEVIADDVSDLEVDEGVLLVEVDLDDVGDEQQGELHPPCSLVLLQPRSDITRLLHIIIEAGIGHLPLHLLQRGPQEEDLQLVHHHDFDHLQHDLPQRHPVDVGLRLTALADALQQHVRAVAELALLKPLVCRLVALLHLALALPLPTALPIQHNVYSTQEQYELERSEERRGGSVVELEGGFGATDELLAFTDDADELVGPAWEGGYFWWRMLSWQRIPRLLFLISGSSLLLD